MPVHSLILNRNNDSVLWNVSRSDTPMFPVGLILSTSETSKDSLVFRPECFWGPPWVNKPFEDWLNNLNPQPREASSVFTKGKIYILHEELNIVEEIPVTVVVERDKNNEVLMTIEFERRNNLIRAKLQQHMVQSISNEYISDKFKEIVDMIENLRYQLLDLSSRMKSIERDDYVEKKDYSFLQLLLKDNLQGVIVLLIVLFSFQAIIVENRGINDVFIDFFGIDQKSQQQQQQR